jgi:hypothetical protein
MLNLLVAFTALARIPRRLRANNTTPTITNLGNTTGAYALTVTATGIESAHTIIILKDLELPGAGVSIDFPLY